MTAPTTAVRFMHLADLHLAPCSKSPAGERGVAAGRVAGARLRESSACTRQDAACHPCIKAGILDRLQRRLTDARTRPDLLLLAGDLTDLWETPKELRAAGAALTRFVATARRHSVVVAGIVGEHDGPAHKLRSVLEWDWLMDAGEVNRETGVAVHAVPGRAKQVGLAAAIRAVRVKDGEPSVLLTHGDLAKIPHSSNDPKFDYYALGHLHWTKFGAFGTKPHGKAGYPGHLFSYWDGCGKAWPTHVLEGAIHPDGKVDVDRVPLSEEGDAPATRRIYIDASHQGQSRGTLVFENAPSPAFFRTLGLAATFTDDRDRKFKNIYRQTARVRYRSLAQMREILKRALESHLEDVFVFPSTGRDWEDRIGGYGSAFLGERFEEFVTKTYKKNAKTQ